MSMTSWDRSAYIYSREVERIRFYQATNQALITAGKIQPGMILVDLECNGSGQAKNLKLYEIIMRTGRI